MRARFKRFVIILKNVKPENVCVAAFFLSLGVWWLIGFGWGCVLFAVVLAILAIHEAARRVWLDEQRRKDEAEAQSGTT